ncbi:MAG TPA: ZIP family metal transporter [bacterium]|nr:ZIP family metal transporter [bacterium]
MSVILLSILTFVSTYFGGLLALRFKNNLHSIMGFTAGVLLGVVSFEIFPEIIELIRENDFSVTGAMVALVAGFLVFHILEKSVLLHHGHEDMYSTHTHPHVGTISALALIGHSLMDGIGIGLAFQINPGVGIAVAIAVISHDFTDGMNTITLMLHNKNTTAKSKLFLLFDALAPIIGALSTLFFTVSNHFLLIYLGFFAGFLLYIGATDILPEAHSKNSSYKTIFLTILGAGLIFIISQLIS